MVQRSSVLGLVAGLVFSFGQGSVAAAADVTDHRPVRVVGLDMSQDRDAALVAARIAKAGLEVCGGGRGSLEIVNRSVVKSECWNQAVDQAAAQLGAPKVAAALASMPNR